jgi:hypothetical protein
MFGRAEQSVCAFWQSNRFSITLAVACLTLCALGMVHLVAAEAMLTLAGPTYLLGLGIGVIASATYCLYQYDTFLMNSRFQAVAQASCDVTVHRPLEVQAQVKTFEHAAEVELHYRPSDQGAFSSIRMESQSGQLFSAVVDPGEDEEISGESIQYYISVHVDGERKHHGAYELKVTPTPLPALKN